MKEILENRDEMGFYGRSKYFSYGHMFLNVFKGILMSLEVKTIVYPIVYIKEF